MPADRTEPVPVFRHVLLTRFNTRRPGSAEGPDDAWLHDRWTLFERFCMPSVARQHNRDFTWLVFFDAGTTGPWRERIATAAALAGFRPVFLDGSFSAGAAAAAISALGFDDAPFLITSRLDNDDALAPHFIADVQRAFRPHRLQFLNFPLGYQLAGGRLYLRPYLASSFISLVEQVGAGPVRTVHFTEHHLIGRYPVRQLWSAPAWLQVIHDRNLANEARGIPVAGRGAAASFGLADLDLAAPAAARRVVAVARFALRGVFAVDARSRARDLLLRRDTSAEPPDLNPSTVDSRVDSRSSAEQPVRVTAVMACHNRRDLTLRALTGWFAQRDHGAQLDAVVVDDGSTDGTAEAVLERFPQVRVIRGDGTLFWAGGMAAAEAEARRTDPDALVWLNDDVVLVEDCLRELFEVSRRFTPAAAVSGALADPTSEEPTYGAVASSRWHPMRTRLVAPSGAVQEVAAVHGNVLLVPRTAYRAAGSIDGGFAHAYADFDYGLRLRALRYPVALTPRPVGWCSRGTSSRRPAEQASPIAVRLRRLNSPRGLPIRSQARYLRRHAGPWWPLLTVAPYVKEIVRGALVEQGGRRSAGARSQQAPPICGHHDVGPAT